MMLKFSIKMVLLCFLFGSIFLTSHASKWRVNNNPAYIQGAGGGFCTNCNTNLQIVVNSASIGDTIYLEPSSQTYGNVTLNKKLTIIGNGYFLGNFPMNDSLQHHVDYSILNGLILDNGSSGSTITGIYFTYQFPYEVKLERVSNIKFVRNYVSTDFTIHGDTLNNTYISQNYFADGHYVRQSNSLAQTITTLNFSNNFISGPLLFADGVDNMTLMKITNNTFYNNNTHEFKNAEFFNNILVQGALATWTTNNNVHHNIANSINGLPIGTGNVNNVAMNFFVTTPSSTNIDRDWQLNCTSSNAACGTGVGGVNMGMFGGTTPYILSGIPSVPSIYILKTPTLSVLQGGNIDINISSRTNQ